MKHDELCKGCKMDRMRQANPNAAARMEPDSYHVPCSKCGKQILGEYEHSVRGIIYCSECVPVE